jgi:hypothetical protein
MTVITKNKGLFFASDLFCMYTCAGRYKIYTRGEKRKYTRQLLNPNNFAQKPSYLHPAQYGEKVFGAKTFVICLFKSSVVKNPSPLRYDMKSRRES